MLHKVLKTRYNPSKDFTCVFLFILGIIYSGASLSQVTANQILGEFNKTVLGSDFKKICGKSGKRCSKSKIDKASFCDVVLNPNDVNSYTITRNGVRIDLMFDPFGTLIAKAVFVPKSLKKNKEAWEDILAFSKNNVFKPGFVSILNRSTKIAYGIFSDGVTEYRYSYTHPNKDGMILDAVGRKIMYDKYMRKLNEDPSMAFYFIDHTGSKKVLGLTKYTDLKKTSRCSRYNQGQVVLYQCRSDNNLGTVSYATIAGRSEIISVIYNHKPETDRVTEILTENPSLVPHKAVADAYCIKGYEYLGWLTIGHGRLDKYGAYDLEILTIPGVVQQYLHFEERYNEARRQSVIYDRKNKIEKNEFGFIQ